MKFYFLIFFSRIFMVSQFIFKSYTFWVYSSIWCKLVAYFLSFFSSFFLHVPVQFSQHHLLKRLSVLHCMLIMPIILNSMSDKWFASISFSSLSGDSSFSFFFEVAFLSPHFSCLFLFVSMYYMDLLWFFILWGGLML